MEILSLEYFNQKITEIFNKKDEILIPITDDYDRWEYDGCRRPTG